MTKITPEDRQDYINAMGRLRRNLHTINEQIHKLEKEYIEKSDLKIGDVVELIKDLDAPHKSDWERDNHPPIGFIAKIHNISISYEDKITYHTSYNGYGWGFTREELRLIRKHHLYDKENIEYHILPPEIISMEGMSRWLRKRPNIEEIWIPDGHPITQRKYEFAYSNPEQFKTYNSIPIKYLTMGE